MPGPPAGDAPGRAGDGERVVHWDGPGLDAWDAWEPAEVAHRLRDVDAAWCVVGGWSIDLFLGRRTRAHEDLEIATTASGLGSIRHALADLVFHTVGSGEVRRLAAGQSGRPGNHQHWVLDETAGAWRVDVMVEPGDGARWVFRRDERVHAPRQEMVGSTVEGIPYLQPQGSLLYKAKALRDKDQADFDAVIGVLDLAARGWLRTTLAVVHPGHPWIERL